MTSVKFSQNNFTAPSQSFIKWPVCDSELLTVQVDGDFSGLELIIEGKNAFDSPNSYPVIGYNLSDFTSISSITTAGIYQFPIVGLYSVLLNLNAISSGEVSIAVRMCREE